MRRKMLTGFSWILRRKIDDEIDGRKLFQLLNQSFFPELSWTANRIWSSYFSLVVSESQTRRQDDKATSYKATRQYTSYEINVLLSSILHLNWFDRPLFSLPKCSLQCTGDIGCKIKFFTAFMPFSTGLFSAPILLPILWQCVLDDVICAGLFSNYRFEQISWSINSRKTWACYKVSKQIYACNNCCFVWPSRFYGSALVNVTSSGPQVIPWLDRSKSYEIAWFVI